MLAIWDGETSKSEEPPKLWNVPKPVSPWQIWLQTRGCRYCGSRKCWESLGLPCEIPILPCGNTWTAECLEKEVLAPASPSPLCGHVSCTRNVNTNPKTAGIATFISKLRLEQRLFQGSGELWHHDEGTYSQGRQNNSKGVCA